MRKYTTERSIDNTHSHPRILVKGLRSPVRGSRPLVRGPRTGVRGPRPLVKGPRPLVRGPRPQEALVWKQVRLL